MGAYQTSATMDGAFFTYGEARGDMVKADNNLVGSDENKLMESNIYPNNWLCNWNKFYQVINYCNDVIKNAPDINKLLFFLYLRKKVLLISTFVKFPAL